MYRNGAETSSFIATTPSTVRVVTFTKRNGAETTILGATTPRQHREGHHSRIEMVRKLLVLAPRHPAETEMAIIYEL